MFKLREISSDQGTPANGCPEKELLAGLKRLGDTGDVSVARGLRQASAGEEYPLRASCGSEAPLKVSDRRLSVQERRAVLLHAGLGGRSASVEECERRSGDCPLGENGGEGEAFREVRKELEYVKVGDAHGEKRAFRGCGAAIWLPQALAETPIGGGDMIRGLRLEVLLMDEARAMSRVSPRGLWELRRGFGGLLASGELRSCCGGK